MVLVEGYPEVVVPDSGRGPVPLALDQDLQGRRGHLTLRVGHPGAVEHLVVFEPKGKRTLVL